MSEQEDDGRRFISRMSDGKPTVGFDDGALTFETEKDAESAAWLMAQAFKTAYAHNQSQLAAKDRVIALLTEALEDITLPSGRSNTMQIIADMRDIARKALDASRFQPPTQEASDGV